MGFKAGKENKIVVDICPFEHDPKSDGKQDIIYREMKDSNGKKKYFMQCGICGCCGPVAGTVKKAGKRFNMRIVKVFPRDEFDRIKSAMEQQVQDDNNKTD